MMMKATLVTLIFIVSTTSGCREGKLMTSYARSMIRSLSPIGQSGELVLQSRYIAGVYLQRGTMKGMKDAFTIEEPFQLICYNETTAALQTKAKIPRVRTSYDFTFTSTKEVRGILSLPVQDFFIDVDIEKNAAEYAPEVLGVYLTQPNDTFDIEITDGADHKDIEKVKFHVLNIAKMVFSRDYKTTMTKEIEPKVQSFLNSNDLLID